MLPNVNLAVDGKGTVGSLEDSLMLEKTEIMVAFTQGTRSERWLVNGRPMDHEEQPLDCMSRGQVVSL